MVRSERTCDVWRKVAVCGVTAAALSVLGAAEARASAGCAYINTGILSNTQQAGLDGVFTKRFSAGDVMTVTLALTGAAHLEVTPTLVNNSSSTQTYTFASDGDYRIYWDARTAASALFTVTCRPAVPTPAPPALQSTVSQSQTKVVSANVSKRLTAIGNPAGTMRITPTGSATGGGRNVPTSGASSDGSLNFARVFQHKWNASHAGRWREEANSPRSFRDLAMVASFDTSQFALHATGTGQDIPAGTIPQSHLGVVSDKPLTLWGHGSHTTVDNNRNRTGDDARLDGDVWAYNLGLDYQFNERFYAGASVGYSDTDLVTSYNTGAYEEAGWTFTPYAVYRPDDALKFSAMAGVAKSSIKQNRDGATVTSSTDAAMWYAAVNGSYSVQPLEDKPLALKARLNVLATHKVIDAYTESDTTVVGEATTNSRQIKPGVEAAYAFDVDGKTVQPFLKADLVYDFKDTINGDRSAWDVGGGVRIGVPGTGLSGSLEGQSQVGRDDYREYTLSGMLAYGFALDGDDGSAARNLNFHVRSELGDLAQVFATGMTLMTDEDDLAVRLNVSQSMPRQAASVAVSTVKLSALYHF